MRLADDLPFEEWKRILLKLVAVDDATHWCLGDALAHGQRYDWGEFKLVGDELGIEYARAKDLAYAARHVHLSIRRADLSWSHHRVVAPLGPEEQRRMLAHAVAERFTVRQIKEAVRGPGRRHDDDDAGSAIGDRVPPDVEHRQPAEQRAPAATKERAKPRPTPLVELTLALTPAQHTRFTAAARERELELAAWLIDLAEAAVATA